MGRFLLNERLKCRHLAVAPVALLLPTAAEVAAGTDLIGSTGGEALESINNFEVQPSSINMGDYSSIREGSLPGPQTYGDASLAIYMDDTARVMWSLFPGLSTGFLLIMPDGESVGSDCNLFPYTVGSRVRRTLRNVPVLFDVNMAIQVEHEGVIAA